MIWWYVGGGLVLAAFVLFVWGMCMAASDADDLTETEDWRREAWEAWMEHQMKDDPDETS